MKRAILIFCDKPKSDCFKGNEDAFLFSDSNQNFASLSWYLVTQMSGYTIWR